MSKLTPIVLELDDDIAPDERMIDIRTVSIKEDDHTAIGYVALIVNENDHLRIRYGNLKCRKVENIKLNSQVLM